MALHSVITGTGSYIPKLVRKNSDFLNHDFLNEDGTPFGYENEEVIEKFKAITGIHERRYATEELNSSDLGYFAAEQAIEDAGIDPEDLDYIILSHNFGDVKNATIQSDILPSLASRVKYRLGIKNPNCVAYDILFGCPGWVQGVIQAEAFIKAGEHGIVSHKRSFTDETYIEHIAGNPVDSGYLNEGFINVNETQSVVFDNPLVLCSLAGT